MIPRSLKYDHVVFDLDGTLVDSRADLADAVNHMRCVLSLPPLPTDTVCRYVGEGVRRLVERALGTEESQQVERGLEVFRKFYSAHLLDRTRLYPDMADVLSTLFGWGVTLSVLSNKPVAMSRAILAGLRVLPLFAAVLGGDSVPARKPDPGGLECLRALTATPPERMLLVGDSIIDVRTAYAGGVAFCGVAWGFALADMRLAGVQQIVEDPRELFDVVSGTRRV